MVCNYEISPLMLKGGHEENGMTYERKLCGHNCLIKGCNRRMKGDCPDGLCRKHCREYCMECKEIPKEMLE